MKARNANIRKAQSIFLPAPIKGLNTVDQPGIMSQEYAPFIVNFLPMQNGLVTRGGSAPYAIDLAGKVETLLNYKNQTLYAVSNGNIYELQKNMPAKKVYENLASSHCQSINFTNSGSTFLWICNGANKPIYFNGEEWLETVISGADNLIFTNVCLYQNRLFLTAKNSLNLYYGKTEAIQGEFSPLLIESYFSRGGEIWLIGSVSVDGGEGPDDYLIVVTSEGEVATFKGRNPDSASSWAMVGKFQIARPLGHKALVKWAGDLIIMTEQGVAGISSMLANELAGLVEGATEKIQATWADSAKAFFNRKEWDICVYHRRGLILVNVPDYIGVKQLIFNPTIIAWAEIQGWDKALCLVEFQGEILAGYSNGVVQQLDYFTADVEVKTDENNLVTYISNPVSTRLQQAFIFPQSGYKSRFTLMRPYIMSTVQPRIGIALNLDNQSANYLTHEVMQEENTDMGSNWYAGEWDLTEWTILNNLPKLRTRWVNCLGVGYSVGVVISIESSVAKSIYTGCDLQFEVAQGL